MKTSQMIALGLLGGRRAAPAFQPEDITGLVHYLASEFGTYQEPAKSTPAVADTDVIGAWVDKSTSAKDVTQATAGNKLQLKLNILNGYSAVRSLGSPRRLTSAAISIPQPFTMFAVVKANSNFGEIYGDANANLLRGNNVFSLTAGTSRASTNPPGGTQVITAIFNNATPLLRVNRLTATLPGAIGAGNIAALNIASAGNPENMDGFRFLIYNSALSAADYGKIEDYLFSFYGARYFCVIGDSKSTYGQYNWRDPLRAALETATGKLWSENGLSIAAAGRTVLDAKNAIDAGLTACWAIPEAVFINLGVNTYAATEAQWKADYQYIINAVAAKYPIAHIYMSKVWRRSVDLTSVNTWIGDLATLNAPRTSIIDDESGWMENGDNGITMSTDGIHYSATGLTTKTALMKTGLGL